MPEKLLLIEEPPSSGAIVAVGQCLAAHGYPAQTLVWDGDTAFVTHDRVIGAILAFPSAASAAKPTLSGWIQQRETKTPVVVVCPACSGGIPSLSSADDFIVPPVRCEEVLARLRRILDGRSHLEQVKTLLMLESFESQLLGADPAFLAALGKARLIAAGDLPALITGETGTGKELFARAIHYLSPRRAFPFIPVDCAALPDQLFENELFGHARGAYTDARSTQEGLAALAEGGTLFLDEVDSLPLAQQAKLLRFIQEKAYRPLGVATYRRANVRIIAATNRDVSDRVHAGALREDLFFRLNVLTVHLPPLRDRASDIPLLAQHFLTQTRPDKTFSPGALASLCAHRWPGNVRELYNTVCRAALFAPGRQIVMEDIGLQEPPGARPARMSFRQARAAALEQFERTYLQQLLAEVRGNITQAAARAGKERRALGRLVQKYRLKPPART